MTQIRIRLLVFPLLLAACEGRDVQAPEAATTTTAPSGEATVAEAAPNNEARPAILLDGHGLKLARSPGADETLLAFGASQEEVEQAVGRVRGAEAIRSTNEECGAGPMAFTSFLGLRLNFQNDKFVGWIAEDGAVASPSGWIVPGMTRAELEKRATVALDADSTLEGEFSMTVDGQSIGGFFAGEGPQAKVTEFYAGTNCFFR